MFWDSSAIVAIVLLESRSVELTTLLANAQPTIWWLTPVECLSAIYRRNRERPIAIEELDIVLRRLKAVVEDADTVSPIEEVRQRASRLLATHTLRAADALQLAAALVWCKEKPEGDFFACLDTALRKAARREGFTVLPKSADSELG